MLLALGLLLEEQHQPGPKEEGYDGGDEHPEEAVVLQDGLHSQLPLVQEEAHLLDSYDVPTLEGGHHYGRRLYPSPPEIAGRVRGDHQAHEVLHQHDDPEHEKAADEDFGGRAVDVGA